MAKMYTLDGKLLVGSPVIQIGDLNVTIDDRAKTVRKVMKVTKEKDETKDEFDRIDDVLKLVMTSKDYKEVEKLDLSFAAYQELMKLVMAALTGEDPEAPGFREGTN